MYLSSLKIAIPNDNNQEYTFYSSFMPIHTINTVLKHRPYTIQFRIIIHTLIYFDVDMIPVFMPEAFFI